MSACLCPLLDRTNLLFTSNTEITEATSFSADGTRKRPAAVAVRTAEHQNFWIAFLKFLCIRAYRLAKLDFWVRLNINHLVGSEHVTILRKLRRFLV